MIIIIITHEPYLPLLPGRWNVDVWMLQVVKCGCRCECNPHFTHTHTVSAQLHVTVTV